MTNLCVCVIVGITESLANEEWLDERRYEVNGFIVNSDTIVTEAPRKARENALMEVLRL